MLGAAHLELQEEYTYELLEYLEVLDPGRTWTKDQLLRNLEGIIIKKAYGVSSISKTLFVRVGFKKVRSNESREYETLLRSNLFLDGFEQPSK